MDLRDCKSIMIYGGSFDPPHLAHTRLPELVRQRLNADLTAYIPAGRQPLKAGQPQTPAHHRLAMLRIALRETPNAVVLEDEIDRAATPPAAMDTPPPASYTVDTLRQLRQKLGPDVLMRLLIGGDCLSDFHRWKEPAKVIDLAEPVVMVRPPDTRESLLASLPAGYEPAEWAPRLIEVGAIDVSSSDIRQRAARGLPLSGLVEAAVEEYIHKHGLYRLPAG